MAMEKRGLQEKWRKAASGEKDFSFEFRYGAHAGLTVREVIDEHPGYCTWMNDNSKMRFTKAVLSADRIARENQRERSKRVRRTESGDSFDYISRHSAREVDNDDFPF